MILRSTCHKFFSFARPSCVVSTRSIHRVVGDIIPPSTVQGLHHLRDSRLNKGLGFSLKERQVLGIHGLLAPICKTQEEQVDLCKLNLEKYTDVLHKYVFLAGLQDRNQCLFYRLVTENPDVLMTYLSPKTMTRACKEFGIVDDGPSNGMFLSIYDKGHCFDVLKNWPEHDVRVVVVTDGECVMGLGDLGTYGMCVPLGKVTKLTALAGIKPHSTLPVLLDVGTNNEGLLEDEYYTGLRQKRVEGDEYYDFVDEFLQALIERFGQNTLIQFENMSLENSYKVLMKYQNKYCIFNDDVQGTAAGVLSGVLASQKLTRKKISENIFFFHGTNQAVLGTAALCVDAMMSEGLSERDACSRIWLNEPQGPVTRCCKDEHKARYAKQHSTATSLEEFIREIKPSVLIGGADGMSEVFAPHIIHTMAQFNDHPVIVCLTSSQEQANCIETTAKQYTQGRSLLLCSHPASDAPNDGLYLGSHALISPGIVLGVMCMQLHHMPEEIFLVAAKALADMVTCEDLEEGKLQPTTTDFQETALHIATAIAEYSYSKGWAFTYPEPADKRQFIKKQRYNYKYISSLPAIYPWPDSVTRPFSERKKSKEPC